MSTVHPGNRTLPLRVVAARWEAESVTSFEFASPDGESPGESFSRM